MSYDASSLRGYLQRIDGTAPAIQGAAAAMMKHYDKSPGVAVNCWRDMLAQARSDQYLPLLYVANEVLQNSKRNRGNRFLEAFSPVLGQSLTFVCGKSQPSTVEGIRRTVKIWAERRVFSVRYVNELIKGLEPYRSANRNVPAATHRHQQPASSRSSSSEYYQDHSSEGVGRFSPNPESPVAVPVDTSMQSKDDFDAEMGLSNNNKSAMADDGDEDMFGGSDDDDDLFGGSASNRLLKIDVDFDRASAEARKSEGTKKKRRRGSNEPAGDGPSPKPRSKRRANTQQRCSTSSLMELMNQVSAVQANYDRLAAKLGELYEAYDGGDDTGPSAEAPVGGELLAEYKKTLGDELELEKHRRKLHSIAQTRRGLELDALRYLPWLEQALKQDGEDIEFSETYRKQLSLFRNVHKPTREARDKRLEEEATRIRKEEESKRKKAEEEERKKFMESAMSKQTEAQPGMVWNRATGEYQHLNQEESWRD